MRRFLLKTLAALVVLAAMVLVAIGVYLRRSLPQVDGTSTVAGLSGPIDIVRDADAIPHVYAANKHDALFGLGYVHAQDRLWQMELQRRIGHGRLSEVLGEAALPQDRFLRTVGFGRAARAAWASMPGWATDQINAYVAGVNAFLSTHHGSALPPEFSLLRFEPEPWTGPDVVVWVKMMAWDLSANYAFELLRHDLVAAVGPARMAQLMPPYPVNGLSIVPSVSTTEDTDADGGHGSRQTDSSAASVTHGPFSVPSVVAASPASVPSVVLPPWLHRSHRCSSTPGSHCDPLSAAQIKEIHEYEARPINPLRGVLRHRDSDAGFRPSACRNTSS
jgi:acyl-homoserine lactone acylase PvdQ